MPDSDFDDEPLVLIPVKEHSILALCAQMGSNPKLHEPEIVDLLSALQGDRLDAACLMLGRPLDHAPSDRARELAHTLLGWAAAQRLPGEARHQETVIVTLAEVDEGPLAGLGEDTANELRRRNDVRVARFRTFLGTLADVDPDAAIVSSPNVFPVVSVRATNQAILRIRLESDLVASVENGAIEVVPAK